MKRSICVFLSCILILLPLSACGSSNDPDMPSSVPPSSAQAEAFPEKEKPSAPEQEDPAGHTLPGSEDVAEDAGSSVESHVPAPESIPASTQSNQPSVETSTHPILAEDTQFEESEDENNMSENTFYVSVGGVSFSAAFAETSGAQALKELLSNGPITISMSDYGGFEKVGSLGQSLTTSDSQTTTQSGDIVLYQGNQIVIFYGSNSWSYTRLGKINDLTGWADALGSGDVSVTLSLADEGASES